MVNHVDLTTLRAKPGHLRRGAYWGSVSDIYVREMVRGGLK